MTALRTVAPARPSPAHRASSRERSRPDAWLRLATLILVTAILFASSGCAVTLLSSYDEETDRAASELITRTETFLARYAAVADQSGAIIRKGRPYDSEAAAFYDDARGRAAAILLRSREKDPRQNKDEIDIVTNLDRRYLRLQDSHRLGTITTTSASGLRRSLRALVHVQLTKKHIGTAKQAAATAVAES